MLQIVQQAQDEPLALLRRVFGFPGFRGQQEQVVRHVVAGGDALVLMPTGGGKSMCYPAAGTVPAGHGGGGLAADRADGRPGGGAAPGWAWPRARLHSDMDAAEARSLARDLIEQQLDLLYVSPERLLGNGTLERLSRLQLALFAIDEAHCVSQWGHEFRPEYRELACLRATLFPGVPRIALTATADARTRADILPIAADGRGGRVPRQLPSAQPASGRRAEAGRDSAAAGLAGAASGRVRHRLLRQPREDRTRGARAAGARASPAIAFHAGLDAEAEARVARRASAPASRWWWWRRSPSAWASTGRMCASWCIWTCRTARRRITSRSAAPAATAIRPTRCCCMAGRTSPAPATGWPSRRRRRRSSG